MKKKNLFVMLMAASMLASCGGTPTPADTSSTAPATTSEASSASATSSQTSSTSSEAPVVSSSEEPTTSSSEEQGPAYTSLVDSKSTFATQRFDMNDLYVSMDAKLGYFGCSITKYYELYEADYGFFENEYYREYDYTKDDYKEDALYFNVYAKLNVLGGYSVYDYASWYAKDDLASLLTYVKEGEEYTAVTEENLPYLKACVASIGGTWTENDYYYCCFVHEKEDYYEELKAMVEAGANEDGFAPVTEPIRAVLMNIAANMWRDGAGYYEYFTFVSNDYLAGKTEYTDSYEPLCDTNGSTKTCVDDAKEYISLNAKFDYFYASTKAYLCAGTDLTTYHGWYSYMFTTEGYNYYTDLITAIGATADADGYAPVTDEIMEILNKMGKAMWNGDNYGAYFCYIKNEEGAYIEWDNGDYENPNPTTDLYVNPTAKMAALAYGTTSYSIYDYYYTFVGDSTDNFEVLAGLMEGNTDSEGYAEVTDAMRDSLKAISEIFWGSENYYYEFEFVKTADVVK